MSKQMRCVVAFVLAVAMLMQPVTAYATDGFDADDLFGSGSNGDNGMDGGARYMSNRYRDNYYLDIEELGILDVLPAGASFLANLVFSLCRLVVQLSVTVFSFCSTFNLADILQEGLNDVQLALKVNLFDILMPFAMVAMLTYVAILYAKRNGAGMLGQVAQFFVIMLSVTLLTTNTAVVVSWIDNLTMAVCNQVMTAMSEIGDADSSHGYAKTVAGNMWNSMVHKPWVELNLDGDDSLTDELLKEKPHSDKRVKIVGNRVTVDNNTLFLKDKTLVQLAFLVVYLPLLIVKCAMFVVIGLMQLTFRIFTVILSVLGILVLFLAMFPQIGGYTLVSSWLRKILSVQLNIVMLSLVLGFIMFIEKALYTAFNGWNLSGAWLVSILLQTGVIVIIFLARNQLLDISKGLSQAVSSPYRFSYNMQRAIEGIDSPAYRATQAAGDKLYSAVHTKKVDFKERIAERRQSPMTAARASNSYYSSTAAQAAEPVRGSRLRTSADVIVPAPVKRPMLYSSTAVNTKPAVLSADSAPRPRLNSPAMESTPAGVQQQRVQAVTRPAATIAELEAVKIPAMQHRGVLLDSNSDHHVVARPTQADERIAATGIMYRPSLRQQPAPIPVKMPTVATRYWLKGELPTVISNPKPSTVKPKPSIAKSNTAKPSLQPSASSTTPIQTGSTNQPTKQTATPKVTRSAAAYRETSASSQVRRPSLAQTVQAASASVAATPTVTVSQTTKTVTAQASRLTSRVSTATVQSTQRQPKRYPRKSTKR